jgi:hypothetical protein
MFFEHINAILDCFVVVLGILLLKRPAQRRSDANSGFASAIEGFERLLEAKDDHILELQKENQFLRVQDKLRCEYEAEIIRRLHECQMHQLPGSAT